jgi:predicted RNA polymerase sigma factor
VPPRAQGVTAARAVEAVWRIEQPKLAARLTRLLRDVGLAEEIAQDAFVLALKRWPRHGIPRNPAAWLTQVAKNRARDRMRRTTLIDGKHRQLAVDFFEKPKRRAGRRDGQARIG